jgi:hypothetical protein
MDLNEMRKIAGIAIVEAAPSAGMTKEEKSKVVKAAKKGEDIEGKGKNFEKIAKKAAAKYGSKEAGEKVAAAVMWKKVAKEDVEYSDEEIDSILESYDDEDEDDMSPAEKELAKMGKGLSKKDEEKIDKADKSAESKAVKKTTAELDAEAKEAAAEKADKAAKKAKADKEAADAAKDGMEESLEQFRQIAGVASHEIIIEGEKDADVYLVFTECFTEKVPVKDIQVFKDAITAKAFVNKMRNAVTSAKVVGKKFSQVKAK